MAKVELYDTTLRDGAQREGISLSVVDKINIALKLDELGVHYIEGGWPGSNPRDAEFFVRARELELKNAKIAVFGSTRRVGLKAEEDKNLVMLVETGAHVGTLVAKASDLQVKHILETTLEENLSMIADSVKYLKDNGMLAFVDAEHFFDGYKSNPGYSLECIKASAEAGADCIILCDTNGGALPDEITAAVKAACKVTKVPLGIHVHNDGDMAVANTLASVVAGVTQVQGTINGYGERCGNANLCSIIPALKLKMGINCVSDEQLANLSEVARFVGETANLVPDQFQPYVGISAFSHKAGYHVAGVTKWADAYQHIDPAAVGNHQRAVVSDLSGKRNITYKAREMGINLSERSFQVQNLLEQVKQLEALGFQYENAEASFELLIHRSAEDYKAPFDLVDYMVIIEKKRRMPTRKTLEEMLAEAMVKVRVDGKIIHTAAEGNGPVNALDQALRKALIDFYPSLSGLQLVDYKVRILEGSTGTGSQVRVLIESSDGNGEWTTVGSSPNIIEASWLALADSIEYFLFRQNTVVEEPKQKKPKKTKK